MASSRILPATVAAGNAERRARDAATSPLATGAARTGFAARGIVYLIVGWLALLAAAGKGGGTTDTHGALSALYQEPFGRALLTLVAIGLAAYALYSLAEGALDLDRRGTDVSGLASRAGNVVAALSYGGLAVAAAQLVVTGASHGSSSDTSTQDWTATLLGLPLGPLLVVIVAAIVAGMAIVQLRHAATDDILQLHHLDLSDADRSQRAWVERLGRSGLAARGVVFAVIAIFLGVAALHRDPNAAVGLGGALQWLAQQPAGQLLLGLVGLGLLTYGVFSLAEGRYRRRSAERGLRAGYDLALSHLGDSNLAAGPRGFLAGEQYLDDVPPPLGRHAQLLAPEDGRDQVAQLLGEGVDRVDLDRAV